MALRRHAADQPAIAALVHWIPAAPVRFLLLAHTPATREESVMSSQNSGPPNDAAGAPFRDPQHWKTGDEPMTAAQKSYLSTLAAEAGEAFDDTESLTKAEAALRIEELQQRTGRGQS
jgi:hypothetical protein